MERGALGQTFLRLFLLSLSVSFHHTSVSYTVTFRLSPALHNLNDKGLRSTKHSIGHNKREATDFHSSLRLKCDGTRAETRFHLSAKRTSPFKSAGASVHSTTGSRGVRISGNNAGYTIFRGSVKGTVYSLNSPVSPSLPLPCVTVGHHISKGLYLKYEN